MTVNKIYDEDGFRVITLNSGYTIRPYLLDAYKNRTRFCTLVLPRRAGKTSFLVNLMIEEALKNSDPSATFLYGFPYRTQAKDVCWPMFKQYLKYLNDFEKDTVRFNENELKITLPNNTNIFIKGLDQPDAIRGGKLKLFIADEWQDCSPYGFDGVIRPALADSGGAALFCGTPRGRNQLYSNYIKGQTGDDPEWSSYIYTSDEIRHLPNHDREIASVRKSLAGTPGLFDQEFMCSFAVAGVGAYYANYLTESETDGRIGNFEHNKDFPVIASFDIGVSDYTVIWFAQQVKGWIHIIDCFRLNNTTNFDDYINVLRNKPYKYERLILPFDSKQRRLGANKTVWELLNEAYPGRVKQANKKVGILDGIQTVKALLPSCKWNREPTLQGRDALFQYRSAFDEKRGVQDQLPIHDYTSHYADSFRYLATGIKQERKEDFNHIVDGGFYHPFKPKRRITQLTSHNPFTRK